MSDEPSTQPSPHPTLTRRLARAFGILTTVATVAILAIYTVRSLRNPKFAWLHVPQQVVQISADSKAVPAIPANTGALTGSNVLLITLDTTRADRLGCYGNMTIKTPTLDRLAREGVLFSNAIAPAPTTLPSHTSILTGLYPAHHGVRSNGLFRLGDAHTTLAEMLGANGYRTGAVVSAFVLDARFGLAQGFADYDDDVQVDGINQELGAAERRAESTVDRALRWLDADVDKPFFLWIHLFDPHANYAPPAPFDRQYAKSLYDGEIAYVDTQIARLTESLERTHRRDRTLIVVAGDHGEGLGEHNEHTHGYLLYDVTLHVPLIFSGPPALGRGVHVEQRVSTADVTPTVLSLLGIAPTEQHDGQSLTAAPSPDRLIFAETYHGMMEYGWAPLLAVYDDDHKLIHGPDPELYDLAKDPFEKNNLYNASSSLVEQMTDKLALLFGAEVNSNGAVAPSEALSPDELARLQALGYVFSGSGSDTPTERYDPKARIDLVNRIFEITCYYQPRGEYDEAIARLEKLAAEYPDAYAVHFNLANAYWEAGLLPEAEASFADCVALKPHAPESLLRIAQVRMEAGAPGRAVEPLEQLLSRHPDHIDALRNLATSLAQDHKPALALPYIERAFELDPHDATALTQWARIAITANRSDELRRRLGALLSDQPDNWVIRNQVATMQVRDKRFADAERTLREGVDRDPDALAARARLAWFRVNCPDQRFRDESRARALLDAPELIAKCDDPEVLFRTALVWGRLGESEQSIALATRARGLADAHAQSDLAERIEKFIQQTRSGLITSTDASEDQDP